MALFLAGPAHGYAQVDVQPAVGDTFEVELAGGESYVGRVVRATSDTMALETVAGARVTLARARLESSSVARGRVVDGEFWHEDPNRTRLFFSPTGRSLPRGGGYFGPKVQVADAPSFNGALGELTVFLPDDGNGNLFGIVYGVGTAATAASRW